MADQPEALRLALAITAWNPSDPARHIDACRSAAAELRRLHAENERLRAALIDAANPIPGLEVSDSDFGAWLEVDGQSASGAVDCADGQR